MIGYDSKGMPDVTFWRDQLHKAEEYRKRAAFEASWDTWRAYYRGEWKEDILPVNLFFAHLRTLVPRVYFRNPAVSIVPEKPGFLEIAFARTIGRIDNKLLRQMDFRTEAKKIVLDTTLFGTGIGKLGFGGEFSFSSRGTLGNEAPRLTNNERIEYNPNVYPNMPWFKRVHPKNFLVPANTDSFKNSRWCAERVFRHIDDVQNDPRLDKKARMSVIATKKGTDSEDIVELYEIRDAKTGKVIVMTSTGHGDNEQAAGPMTLLSVPDRLIQDYGFNYYPVVFNPDDENFWGVPDSKILEPYQLEANENRTLMMKHRRLSIVKILAKRGVITEEEKEKLLSGDVAAVVELESDYTQGSIDKLTVAEIPQSLLVNAREIEQDVRMVLGLSKNQMGEFASRRGDITAEEVETVRESSDIRIDEKRDEMAQMLTAMMKKMNGIIFERWTADQVLDVVGPGGAQIWVKFNPTQLRMAHYDIRVDADTSTPRTREYREQKALALYQVLKENPLIDPQALTQYLLNEIEGTEMDTLMRALPPPEQVPQGPVGLGQFAGLIQNSVQRAQNGVPPGLLGE